MAPQTASPPVQVASRPEAQALVAGVLAIMKDLAALLEQETAHIRVGKLREGLADEARKSALTSEYLKALQAVKANAVALARVAPDQVEELKRAHGRFGTIVQTNQTVLATARAVSESMVKGIVDILNQKERPSTYGPGSTLSTRPAARAEPLVLSRRL